MLLLILGDILGEWAEEDVSIHGIIGFVGLGPKSYALKYLTPNGEVKEKVKMKGVAYKQSHVSMLNYRTMKNLVLNPHAPPIQIPQFNFIGQGEVTTVRTFKDVKFNRNDLKGELKPKPNGLGHKLFPLVKE